MGDDMIEGTFQTERSATDDTHNMEGLFETGQELSISKPNTYFG